MWKISFEMGTGSELKLMPVNGLVMIWNIV